MTGLKQWHDLTPSPAVKVLKFSTYSWFSHGLENLENGNTFSSQRKVGISNRLEKSGNFTKNTGKVRGSHPKYWKTEGILTRFYFIFSLIFLIEMYLLDRFFYLLNSLNKTLKNILENIKKILEKSGKFVSLKMWEP